MSAAADRPTALLTGANGGLGLETSNQLRAKGFRVILTSRDEKKGTASARGLDPAGRDVAYHQLDITDAASISAVAHDLPGLAARLNLLVNNAGIGSWGADRRASARTIATNYFGSRDVTDALLPSIREGGRIVMVSSGLGELSYMGRDLRPRFADQSLNRTALDSLVNSYLSDLEKGEAKSEGWPSAYSVSKVAMNALTRILARELAPRKISINSVCPGWVRTDMGGPGANRSVEVGARSIVLGAMLPDDATGAFIGTGRRFPGEGSQPSGAPIRRPLPSSLINRALYPPALERQQSDRGTSEPPGRHDVHLRHDHPGHPRVRHHDPRASDLDPGFLARSGPRHRDLRAP